MGKLLYQQNRTMEVLARQPIFTQNGGEYGEIRDIVSAYKNADNGPFVFLVMDAMEQGFLSGFLRDVYALGKIHGIKEERTKRKGR